MATPEKKSPQPEKPKAETSTPAVNEDAARRSMSADALRLGLTPDNAIYFYNRAQALFAENRFDEAQAAARCACECDNTMTLAWLLRGLALAQTLDFKDAKACLLRVTELDRGSIIAWTNLGEVCLKLYEYEIGRAHV